MAKSNSSKSKITQQISFKESNQINIEAVRPRKSKDMPIDLEPIVHLLKPGILCDTESRGYSIPKNSNPLSLVVDSSAGFVPLWDIDTVLRWRFRERSMAYFANPIEAKLYITNIFGEALLAWGNSAPVSFKYDEDVWDFEFVMQSADQCNGGGCVLASAFFPGTAQHNLTLYPKLFGQTRKEQVDTLVHEIGHVFGLRHFFAKLAEGAWPSQIFGRHHEFSIMNYGNLSELTNADKEDLELLYRTAWNGSLTHINGTPIRFIRPYSSLINSFQARQATHSQFHFINESGSALIPFSALPKHITAKEKIEVTQSRSNKNYLDGKC
jgi:hypothetical protein